MHNPRLPPHWLDVSLHYPRLYPHASISENHFHKADVRPLRQWNQRHFRLFELFEA
ncbi:hypothetical protein BKA66DRAFT_470406 [Pyrenochaeta sp. MPI-SDFR-AT-0127]|nr:hypothetical protein BKA66DRAFT_470406 [Pyrenochaeta sp. MPI-SDFR-AT-0127]